MLPGLDKIITDLWAKFPYLCMVGIDEMYVVHLGRYCWPSTWSGLALPFLLRYDRFDVTEQAFETRRRVCVEGQSYLISVAGSYRWTDPVRVVRELGYNDAEALIATKLAVKACELYRKGLGNPELLAYATTTFPYMDWIFVDMMSTVPTIALDHIGALEE